MENQGLLARSVSSCLEDGHAASADLVRGQGRSEESMDGFYAWLGARKSKRILKLLMKANKRLSTGYFLKEEFEQLLSYQREGWARRFFDNWRDSLREGEGPIF